LFKDSGLGLPESGNGGPPESGRAGLPESGSQEKRDKEKRSKKEERHISATPIAPAQPPVNRKVSEAEFDKLFPQPAGYVAPLPKTDAERIEEMLGLVNPAKAPEKKSTVSGITGQPPENMSPTNSGEAAQTTPPTDTERRQND